MWYSVADTFDTYAGNSGEVNLDPRLRERFSAISASNP